MGVIEMRKILLLSLCILFILYLCIVVANNQIARNVEKHLCAVPAPENTDIVSSISVAGKLWGCGNGMQYTGALLLKTSNDNKVIEDYYRATVSHDCDVYDCLDNYVLPLYKRFNINGGDDGFLILVLTLESERGNLPDNLSSIEIELLNMDLRGH